MKLMEDLTGSVKGMALRFAKKEIFVERICERGKCYVLSSIKRGCFYVLLGLEKGSVQRRKGLRRVKVGRRRSGGKGWGCFVFFSGG